MRSLLVLSAAALALSACAGDDPDIDVVDAAEVVDRPEGSAPIFTAGVEPDFMEDPEACTTMGAQTPRDISFKGGLNTDNSPLAGDASGMNLCNIHFHAQAEHKGPGFSMYAGPAPDGGYRCNGTNDLSAAERASYDTEHVEGVEVGDTIEVHWVHTTCDVTPGEGLGSCLSDTCESPRLRVETQVFLVVNDRNALDMTTMDYVAGDGTKVALHQPGQIPTNTGTPVVFRGSTTGPSYTDNKCSPLNVTWSVRPQCAKIDIASLDAWAEDNVFNEDEAHGVRTLVRDPRLVSPID